MVTLCLLEASVFLTTIMFYLIKSLQEGWYTLVKQYWLNIDKRHQWTHHTRMEQPSSKHTISQQKRDIDKMQH